MVMHDAMDAMDVDIEFDIEVKLAQVAQEQEAANPAPRKKVSYERAIVCKHWLRGLCKKGPDCDFLHELNLKKMPECWFFNQYGQCTNPDCEYRHIRPEDKLTECPWYARGHCKHGNRCRNRHVKKRLCMAYFAGFCPKGPECQDGHPKWELPSDPAFGNGKAGSRTPLTCHKCRQPGHKAAQCPNSDPSADDGRRKPIDEVTCFKCGELGHYANHCPTSMGGGGGPPRGGGKDAAGGLHDRPFERMGGAYKTQMCRFAQSGTCRKGAECTYAHSEDELASYRGHRPPPAGGGGGGGPGWQHEQGTPLAAEGEWHGGGGGGDWQEQGYEAGWPEGQPGFAQPMDQGTLHADIPPPWTQQQGMGTPPR